MRRPELHGVGADRAATSGYHVLPCHWCAAYNRGAIRRHRRPERHRRRQDQVSPSKAVPRFMRRGSCKAGLGSDRTSAAASANRSKADAEPASAELSRTAAGPSMYRASRREGGRLISINHPRSTGAVFFCRKRKRTSTLGRPTYRGIALKSHEAPKPPSEANAPAQ